MLEIKSSYCRLCPRHVLYFYFNFLCSNDMCYCIYVDVEVSRFLPSKGRNITVH